MLSRRVVLGVFWNAAIRHSPSSVAMNMRSMPPPSRWSSPWLITFISALTPMTTPSTDNKASTATTTRFRLVKEIINAATELNGVDTYEAGLDTRGTLSLTLRLNQQLSHPSEGSETIGRSGGHFGRVVDDHPDCGDRWWPASSQHAELRRSQGAQSVIGTADLTGRNLLPSLVSLLLLAECPNSQVLVRVPVLASGASPDVRHGSLK
jgi:hypothetical protein